VLLESLEDTHRISRRGGDPPAGEAIQELLALIEADKLTTSDKKGSVTEKDISGEYHNHIVGHVKLKRPMKIAIDAIGAASHPHHFLSVTKAGHSAIVHTSGNPDCHVILRGGKEPNYSTEHVKSAAEQLIKVGLSPKLMVDCSHANSRKDYRRQMEVAQDVAAQLENGEDNIMGVMVESHLVEGRQDLVEGKPLTYGQSITDACIGWEDTEIVLKQLSDAVLARRKVNG